jgi:Na+/H+ antiporter NhaB
MLINNVVTVIASVFVGYYKVREMVADYKEKQNKRQITDDDEQMIMELSEL